MSTALRLCVLALCCAAQLADAQVLGYISHSFSLIRSDTLENAEYKLVSNVTARDGYTYEERVYPAAKWACTARTIPRTESSPTRSMFMDLFRYFAGDNVDRKEIELTVPVNTFVQQRENDVTFYETCLVLPSKSREAAPKPTNPSVFLDDKPDRVVLTRRVSGYFVSDVAWEEESVTLKKMIKEKDPEADFSGYYRNGYDAPMRLFNRRNEVWFVKKGEKAAEAIEAAKKEIAEEKAKLAEELKKKEDEKLAIEMEKLKKKADKKKAQEDKKKAQEEKKQAAKPVAEDTKKVEEDKKAEPVAAAAAPAAEAAAAEPVAVAEEAPKVEDDKKAVEDDKKVVDEAKKDEAAVEDNKPEAVEAVAENRE